MVEDTLEARYTFTQEDLVAALYEIFPDGNFTIMVRFLIFNLIAKLTFGRILYGGQRNGN